MKGWQWGNEEDVRRQDSGEVREHLASLGVTHQAYPIAAAAAPFLEREQLDAEDQERLLTLLDPVFRELQQDRGYQDRDLVVLYPAHPQLDALGAQFCRIHVHQDEEVRFVVEGEGIFGFVLPDGRQLELVVTAGDYLHIPSGVEHWFRLGGLRRIKAVRYFSARGGWTPVYTDRARQRFSGA